MNFEHNTETETFLDLITTNSLVPLILKPTRITSHSQTLIDNILTNITENKTVAGNITTSISDHLMQFAIFQTDAVERREETTPIHDFRNFDRNDFILDILQVDWNKHIEIHKEDINKSMENFLEIFDSITQKHAPLTKPAKRKAKRNNKPWITTGLLNAIQKRNSLYKSYIKEKNPQIKTNLHEQYKTYRNLVTTLCRDRKNSYFKKFFSENKNNLKNAWKGIKSIINSKSRKNSVPVNVIVNGANEKDPNLISNAFNSYFGTIADKTKAKIPKTNKQFGDYLTNPSQETFFLRPTSAKEIQNIISSLDNTKAVGHGSIPTRLLKIAAPTISELLCQIVNLSFKNGIFPECLKEANIIPIHKKDARNIIGNYRPISLLSNISKIIEKLIQSRVYSFLTKNNLLFKNQYGFRNQHNTNHALIQITEKIRHAIDNNQLACGVFVDLQKAFDTVEHSILLDKLYHYGLRGVSNDWFKSFLTNRQQHVTVLGKKSHKRTIIHGVPQGSVLGPLLFLIYINDLHKSIKSSEVYHFADDTSLIQTNTSLKKLNKNINHDLKLLCEWLRANKISLNSGKTELILFRPKQKTINKNLNFRISGQKLHPQTSVKYLGVQIDEHLTFHTHLKTLVQKLSRAVGMLAKVRHYVPQDTLKNIYFAIFNSDLIYGSQVWIHGHSALLEKIQILQNKALRVINFKTNRESANQLYKQSNIVKISDNTTILNCLFVHDHQNGILPDAFNNFIKRNEDVHSHNTRISTKKKVVPTNRTLTYGIKSVTTRCTSDWNRMQKLTKKDFIKFSKSKLKITLKNYFLDIY